MQECGRLWTTVLLMLMPCVQWAEHLWIGEGGRRMPHKAKKHKDLCGPHKDSGGPGTPRLLRHSRRVAAMSVLDWFV